MSEKVKHLTPIHGTQSDDTTTNSVAYPQKSSDPFHFRPAIPQPGGQACSKRNGRLEMPALRRKGRFAMSVSGLREARNRELGTPRLPAHAGRRTRSWEAEQYQRRTG